MAEQDLNPRSEHGSGGSAKSERGSSKVSFFLKNTSDSQPVSERFSMMLNASPDSNTFFAFSKSGSNASEIDQTERDSFSFPSQDSSATTSLLSFSLMHSGLPQSSRAEQVFPKERGSSGSFVSITKATLQTGSEARPAHRLIPHRPSPKISSIPEHIQKRILPFYVTLKQLQSVKNLMVAALEKGLKEKDKATSYLPMLPTYVCALPDGSERGDFLGLELTFDQVKVLLLQLTDNVDEPMVVKKKTFSFPEKILSGNGQQVFEFMAQCLSTFLGGLNLSKKYFPLGFSFPFPCDHTALNQCKLIRWTKDFRWPGVEGKDVTKLLQTAINEVCKNYQIEVLAVVNDTVGDLMSCSSNVRPCQIGVMIDAGTNCCYMEDTQRIPGNMQETRGHMCISTEWGNFGNNGELNEMLTEFDTLVDKESMDQGKCRFEKMTSSYYVRETVRIILANLSENAELFSGVLTPTLLIKGKLALQDIVEVTDDKVGLAKTKNFLCRLGLVASNQDCFHVQEICQAVYTRSAKICAAGMAGVLTYIHEHQQLPEMKTCVVMNGDMYKSHLVYTEILQQTLKELVPEYSLTFTPSDDGSTLGAAIVTAVEVKLRNHREGLAQVLAPLKLSIVDLERLRNGIRQEMENGLSKAASKKSCLRMLPTFVCYLPDGSERGDFLALDLGGTNFRVLMVQVKSQEEGGVHIINETYTIPPEITQSTGVQLFDHIVNCMVDFHIKHGMAEHILPLGFTFSFPCNQITLDKGILLRWTKGFSATDCVGEDVVNLLRDAVQRQKTIDVDVVALVNDTVGTMMSCAYLDHNCEVGLIVGTGCNACYMEEMRNVGSMESNDGRMCINMEWGAFGDDGCLDHYITPYDDIVDKESLNPNQQRFEKMISGMYLGEIVRYVLLELASRKILFRDHELKGLQNKGIFPTKLLSDIENDSESRQHVYHILEELGLPVSPEDAKVVKEVCHTVTSRAAMMCAAGVAAVVEKIRENKRMTKVEVTVGVDGTVYKMNPYFAKKLQDTVALLAPNCNVKFLLSEDGSGKGAALIAAVACRTKIS
ncbi:hexokinase-3 isoform X1 [Crotalus tigris]|uniref:hexokinase-3 isoform X1 n=2 Tax=Crotalus tigris TaxID=88082 RepID=UPI00192F8331|nr:hexokinase-3 isoform X1 [Crotalus tigris]